MLATKTDKHYPCTLIRTAAAVIMAVCLVLITTSLGIAGVYTVRTINTVNTKEIHKILTTFSSASNLLSDHGSVLQDIPDILHQVTPLMQQSPEMVSQLLKTSGNIKDIVGHPVISQLLDLVPLLQSLPQMVDQVQSTSLTAHKMTQQIERMLQSPFLQKTSTDLQHTAHVFTAEISQLIALFEKHENLFNDLSWAEHISSGVEDLSISLNKLPFNKILEETQQWRNMSTKLGSLIHAISPFL
jgi:hypothetical protein